MTRLVSAPGGRVLEVLDSGGDGFPCLFHNGTPGGPVPWEAAIEAAARAGLRWITYARPGYGESTPLTGRDVAQAALDTATVLGALGVGDFVTYGWSGGGPHALACGALLPGRCRAVSVVAGVAPYRAQGLDFLAGMGEDNVEELGRAARGREVVLPYLQDQGRGLARATADDIADSLGNLISEVDRAALTGDFAEYLSASARAGLRHGVTGWLDDDLAFVTEWGFELLDVRAPVTLWQGGQDLMVPFAHGQWLAAHLPGVTARLLPDQGHLSLAVGRLPEILADLAAAA